MEYRKLLDLGAKDNVRRTLYVEVLRVVSSFENGVAFEITRQAKERGPLTVAEVSEVCQQMAELSCFFARLNIEKKLSFCNSANWGLKRAFDT